MLAPLDGYQHYLPLHVLAARALKDGHLPVWNPFTFSGYPLLATNQAAVFYPPNLVFAVLPAIAANNVVVIFNFVLAGGGAFFLSRRLCGDDTGALVSGVAFAFCGFMFAHITHQSVLASVAWLPWALLGYERLRERFSAGRLAAAAAALAMVGLAGHSQMFGFVAGAVVVYGLASAAVGGPGRGRALAAAGAVLVAGAALAAVQLLPTLAILGETDRAQLDYDAATTYSLPISHTPLLVFPYLFGAEPASGPFTAPYRGAWELRELSGYAGAAVLVLAAAGAGAWRRDRRVVALGALGFVSLVAALGSSTPFGRVLYAIPVAGHFRAWGRYIVGFDLAAAVLAGYGVAALRNAVSARAAARAALMAAGGIVAVALVAPRIGPVARHVAHGGAQAWSLALPVLAAVVAAVLATAVGRRARGAAGALVLVVAIDLVVSFGLFTEWRSASPDLDMVRAALDGRGLAVGRVPDAPGGIDRYVDVSASARQVRNQVDLAAVSGYRSVNGFDPLAPRDYVDAVGRMSYFGLVTRPQSLTNPPSHLPDLLRVSLLVDDDPGGGPARHWERVPALPESFLAGGVTRVSRDDALAAAEGRIPFDPAATALIEKRCPRCASAKAPGAAGESRVVRREPGRTVLDALAGRPAVAVVSEAWFPGWRATVDGRPAPVLRVDGVVQGVPIPAGRHRIELRYRAPGLRAGALLSIVTAVALVIAVLVERRGGIPATRGAGRRA